MIVNIRGTNGSGKSTLVRALMTKYGSNPITDDRGKEIGYRLRDIDATVVGRYATACGGCDTIKTQDETKQRIRDFGADSSHVFFEGILVSTIFGPWLDFSRTLLGGMVWAFMDTPLNVCLERIQIRNGGKPIKTEQVEAKWIGMIKIQDKAREAGEHVLIINHTDPLASLLGQLGDL